MKKSIQVHTLAVLLAMSFSLTASAQLASDKVRTYAKQQMQHVPAEQRNVHHNTLTAANRNQLASNTITKINQQEIPVSMRSKRPAQPNNYSSNKPRVLASNSPKLRQKKQPKRPPALPVVF